MASNQGSGKIYQITRSVAFFGWAVIVLILSILPSNELIKKSNEGTTFRLDYLEHFLAFLFFALLFGLWQRTITGSKNRKIIYFLVLGVIYAASAELVQLFIESRTFNPVDLWFNLGGLLVGTALTRIYIFK